MKKNTSTSFILLAICSIFLFSASKTKKLKKNIDLTAVDADSAMEKIASSNLEYEYLEASGTAIIRSDKINVSGSFLLRLHKDQSAWMRIQKFGFEAVRVLLQNDTVTVLNRLEKSFQKMSMDEASTMTHLNLDQNALIDLMAGNSILEESEFIGLVSDSSSYTYKVAYDDFYASYIYDTFIDQVVSTEFLDLDQRAVQVKYSDFGFVDENQTMGLNRIYKVRGTDLGDASLELKIKEVKINEQLSFPFEIPTHYKRIR